MSVRARTYFDADQILDSGACSEGSETVEYYHCTPAKNIPLIMKQGLKPGNGKNFETEEHSTGKVFLAAGMDEALMWQSFLEQLLFTQIAILRLFLGPSEVQRLKVDTLSWDDGNQCSFYLTNTIPPSKIEIENLGKKINAEAESTAESIKYAFANILEDFASAKESLARYRRTRKSSPVVWAASVRRAKLVTDLVKKNRHVVSGLLPYMRLLSKEASEDTMAEPSVQNVKDAIAAIALDDATRDKAYTLYVKLDSLHKLFSTSRHRKKNTPTAE